MEPIAHGTRRNTDLCCWPECFQPVEHHDLPLCESHFREAGLAWMRDHIDLVREVTGPIALDVVVDQARRLKSPTPPPLPVEAIVYYLQVRGAERVKIGTTTNLRQRMVSLRADGPDLLATEPGGHDVEWRRHQQFADERYGRREEFALSDRLAAHIASLQ